GACRLPKNRRKSQGKRSCEDNCAADQDSCFDLQSSGDLQIYAKGGKCFSLKWCPILLFSHRVYGARRVKRRCCNHPIKQELPRVAIAVLLSSLGRPCFESPDRPYTVIVLPLMILIQSPVVILHTPSD